MTFASGQVVEKATGLHRITLRPSIQIRFSSLSSFISYCFVSGWASYPDLFMRVSNFHAFSNPTLVFLPSSPQLLYAHYWTGHILSKQRIGSPFLLRVS